MSTTLQRLSKWYAAQCNGTWEHDWGISIQTIDNPGWMLEVNLDGTPLHQTPFKLLKARRSETDWIECGIQDHGRAGGEQEGRVFVGAGGPGNLEEIIMIFCDWAERAKAAPPQKSQAKRPNTRSGPRRF